MVNTIQRTPHTACRSATIIVKRNPGGTTTDGGSGFFSSPSIRQKGDLLLVVSYLGYHRFKEVRVNSSIMNIRSHLAGEGKMPARRAGRRNRHDSYRRKSNRLVGLAARRNTTHQQTVTRLSRPRAVRPRFVSQSFSGTGRRWQRSKTGARRVAAGFRPAYPDDRRLRVGQDSSTPRPWSRSLGASKTPGSLMYRRCQVCGNGVIVIMTKRGTVQDARR